MAKSVVMIYCSLMWWCYYFNTPATCLPNQTDGLALMSIKAAIDEDPFGALSSWNDSLHYCHWNGVLCGRRHRHRVVALNLNSQLLVGSLSPHIGNLSFLKSVNLGNNSFRGQFPPEIGGLFRLQTINFSSNSFGGEVPSNLSRCSNLYYLNLVDNLLTGHIPAGLGSLSKLRTLGLGKNQLSGTIPPSIGNLSSLSVLNLMRCGLHGEIPEKIAQLQGLTSIQFEENNLSGNIPSALYNISTIEYLSVAINQLQGSIPPHIGLTLPNLKYLHFGHNLFTGTIPNSVSNASGLAFIAFNSNYFTGPMPKHLGKLSGLEVMNFDGNQIREDISFISSLANCSRLRTISIGHNFLTGSLPESIGNLSTHIRSIAIDHNQLHGSIPLGIENLSSLNDFSLAGNDLTGRIPPVIGKLNKLQDLHLGENELTGELPSSLGNLTLLNHIALGHNNIYGSIPPSLGNCINLLWLDLSYNNLNGTLPREILNLSSISVCFNLSNNDISGSLATEVGTLVNLVELDLSNNRLSGFIPNSLSNCMSLERLYLPGNSFEGEIPRGVSALRGLRVLDLSGNNLSGPIPSYLDDLPLEKLNLSYNGFLGEVPIQGVFQNASTISVEGNNELCGGIVGLNLPPCLSLNSKKNNLLPAIKVIIPVVVVVVALFFTLLVCFYIFRHHRAISSTKGPLMASFKNQIFRVSFAELVKATDGFSEANLIGLGSYGSVYRGILHQGQTMVAVKVLNLQRRGASKSFMSECNALRSTRHRNLLKIFSACSTVDFQGNDFKALVFEYMANGNLEKWLHQETKYLKLIQRLNIAIDIACALEYLHYGSECGIVHGDLKPSNVLLDDEMTAQIGDFGLAKVLSTASSEHQSNSVAVRGTVGYVAPEYGMGGMLSTLGDVYSYGILVLEMFTGKKPTDDSFKDGLSLHKFIKNSLADQRMLMEIVDPRILLEHHDTPCRIKDCIVSVLRIGAACSMEAPRDRMEIGDVVSELHKTKNDYTRVEGVKIYCST